MTRSGHVYTPDTADEWKEQIELAVSNLFPGVRPLKGPLRIDWVFYFARPKYMLHKKYDPGPIWKDSKPDKDNLEKAGLDAITDAGLIADDAIVVAGDVQKYWCAFGGAPGARLRVLPASTACDLERRLAVAESAVSALKDERERMWLTMQRAARECIALAGETQNQYTKCRLQTTAHSLNVEVKS
jgi:Holliday junction resolvase RusA-like endonuclease